MLSDSPNVLGLGFIVTFPSPNFIQARLRLGSLLRGSHQHLYLAWSVSSPPPLLPKPLLLPRIMITSGNGMS